jgi:hypothetical protein
MSPDLSRRDALVALGAAGVATAGLGALTYDALEDDDAPDGEGSEEPPATPPTPEERATLTAAAEALYPTEVEGVGEFVETYVVGRLRDRPDHAEGVREAAHLLDEYARTWYDSGYADLDRETRQDVFEEFRVDTADPVPDGVERERVRYYVVNELLFALYSSPTGGELLGLENPPGHPGGTGSYRRGPE